MTTIMWEMDVVALEEFFKRVKASPVDTEEVRMNILSDMAEEGYMKSVIATERSKEEIVKDKMKQYGNVLDLTGEKNAPETSA